MASDPGNALNALRESQCSCALFCRQVILGRLRSDLEACLLSSVFSCALAAEGLAKESVLCTAADHSQGYRVQNRLWVSGKAFPGGR